MIFLPQLPNEEVDGTGREKKPPAGDRDDHDEGRAEIILVVGNKI